jgi:RND family efflux transporter MFP subunit
MDLRAPVLAASAGILLAVLADGAPVSAADGAAQPGTFVVVSEQIDDRKSIYATVRSKDILQARVRTPGTIVSLRIDKGDHVEPGQLVALVVDPKIALKIRGLDAQIVANKSRLETARTELDRAQELKAKGFSSQARVDQAQTAFDVATNDLKASQAERSVVETQVDEGKVLAPAAGRVLAVPVTEGAVVMSGESIATIAGNEFLLRMELPERHARFIKPGDPVHAGARGLAGTNDKPGADGKVVKVYPEIQNGRVIADAEMPNLGNYFVGERILTSISAGTRKTFVVPRSYLTKRFGLDYARLLTPDGKTYDVVIQTGQEIAGGSEPRVEVLAGLAEGDKLVQP